MSQNQIAVTGAFDDLRLHHLRFLEAAAGLGEVTVFLSSDDLVRQFTGKAPKFPEAERSYLLQAIRFVHQVRVINSLPNQDALPGAPGFPVETWVVPESQNCRAKEEFCRTHGIEYRVLWNADLQVLPARSSSRPNAFSAARKVIVTGCYDWFHSGHVRFFEEVSAYGHLYVVVGHDANIRQLKGEGHPFVPQEERRYMVGSVRYVTQAVVSSGQGWLDAEPEIELIKPDIYAVNEDGDKGGKREFCAQHGLEYLVLKRRPAPGLPQRTSTNLRGF